MPWTCSHGCQYSDVEMEIGMKLSTLDWLMEQDRAEHELQADLDHEERLARDYVLGNTDVPWPWYADDPCCIEEPEIIEC